MANLEPVETLTSTDPINQSEAAKITMEVLSANLEDLQRKVNSVSRRSTTFPKFTFVMLIAVFLGFIVATNFLYGRVATLESSLKQTIAEETTQQKAVSILPDEAVQYLSNQLDYLELRQTAILDEARDSLNRFYLIFSTIAAFFGLFTLYFGYRQISFESQKDESSEKYDQEMRNLVKSFQENITTISSLITTLEQSYAYRQDIETQLSEIAIRAEALEAERKERETKLNRLIDSLNSEAIQLFETDFNRKTIYQQESRNALEIFRNKINSAETENNIQERLNPICYYIRGLSYISRYQFIVGIRDLQTTFRLAKLEQQDTNPAKYIDESPENIKIMIRKTQAMSCYFQAFSYRYLGNYKESINQFKLAAQYDRENFEAKVELLQVMYFEKDTPFRQIERAYSRTTKEFRDFEIKHPNTNNRNFIDANKFLYIFWGNMYVKKRIYTEGRSYHRRHEDPMIALAHYRDAYDRNETGSTAFALAYAMEEVNSPSEWRRTTPIELYEKAADLLRRRILVNNDSLNSVSLYYMLALCAIKSNSPDNATAYFSEVDNRLQELPSNILLFSPVSKVMLDKAEFSDEIAYFKRIL